MEQVPFRMIFEGYDGDPKRDPPERMTFQVDTVDFKQPSAFMHLGEQVPHTKFKLDGFAYKTEYRENIKANAEASELTLLDTETGERIVLPLNRTIDYPDKYAQFEYEWPDARNPQVIRVKSLQEFLLKPEIDAQHHYRLMDVTETEAQIQTPTGSYKVTIDPRHVSEAAQRQ
jgi:hypothetical protein